MVAPMPLLRFLGFLLDLLFYPLRALRRGKVVPEGTFLTLKIDGAVMDVLARPRFWEIRAQKAISLHDVRELVDHAIADPRVRGLLVTIKSLAAGMATSVSLRDQLARARAAGKEVVVHLPLGGGTKEVIVASAGSKVLLGPAAQLSALGFATRTRYVKSALDKAGDRAGGLRVRRVQVGGRVARARLDERRAARAGRQAARPLRRRAARRDRRRTRRIARARSRHRRRRTVLR